MFCPSCWSPLESEATHCSDCGSPIELFCPQCDAGLAGTMVCCSLCGLDLSYLSQGASIVDSVFPSPTRFRHPLEVSRFSNVTDLSDISFLVHRALELSVPLGKGIRSDVSERLKKSSEIFSNSPEESVVSKAFIALAPFSHSSFTYTEDSDQSALTLGGSFSNPSFIANEGRARLLVSDEINFLGGTLLFSLYGGFFPYCLLAQAIEDGRITVPQNVERTLVKWFESYWYSADRFSALLFKKPGVWLRSFLKLYTSKVDLVSLIDINLKHFPSNPGMVASSLKGFPDLVRRLVELSDFVKGEVYGTTSSNLIDELAQISVHGGLPTAGLLSEVDPSVAMNGHHSLSIVPPAVSASGASSSSTALLAGDRLPEVSSLSVLYLSSFRNELIMLHPDMSLFQTIKLHDLCRHPRNITAIVDQNIFFISDFETSRIVAIDYKGNHLFDVGEPGALSHPSGMTIDGDYNLWVTDSWNNRLVQFTASSKYREALTFLDGQCKRPLDICFDVLRGGFWICDTGSSRIFRMSEDGDILFSFGSEYLSMADNICISSGGGLLVSDSQKGSLLSFEATGEYLGDLSKQSLGRPVYLDSMDIGPSGEILISEKGCNRMLLSSDSGESFKSIPVPVQNANENGFPCDVMAIPDLVRRISKL